ncbi:unnamed protein product [Arabidopsis lyrata]|nr:unnamed protein product [Arabidopsis lyrata]
MDRKRKESDGKSHPKKSGKLRAVFLSGVSTLHPKRTTLMMKTMALQASLISKMSLEKKK